MIKQFMLILFMLLLTTAYSQNTEKSTDQFTIEGLVEHPVTIGFADLLKETIINAGSFKLTNHLGEPKKEYRNIKAVLLRDVLQKVTISTPDVRLLNEYYFVVKGSDGYAAVISWNELFNSAIGDSFLIVLEADNLSQKESAERILLIATKDIATGRRFLKHLKSIEVKRM